MPSKPDEFWNNEAGDLMWSSDGVDMFAFKVGEVSVRGTLHTKEKLKEWATVLNERARENPSKYKIKNKADPESTT